MTRLAEVEASAAAFWRLALAVPPLFLVIQLSGERLRSFPRRLVGMMAATGVLYGIGMIMMCQSALTTSLANCALIGNFSSFLFAGVSLAALRKLPSPAVSLALIMSMAGLGLLLGPSVAISRHAIMGDLLALGAAILFTGYFIILARVPLGARPMTLHGLSTAAGALAIAPFALAGNLVPGHWWPLFVIALGGQMLGQGMVVYAVPRLPAVFAGLCILLFPLANMGIGWIWYGEAMVGLQLVGASLIILALVLLHVRGKAA